LKILFVSEYYYPHIGGVEVVFKNITQRLAKMGYQCRIVTSGLPDSPQKEDIDNVEIYRIKVSRKGDRYWFSLLAIPKVIKMARQADIIHTTTYNAVFPAWLAARVTGTKSVITIHEIRDDLWLKLSGMNTFTAGIHRLIEKILLKLLFDATVCVSNYTYNSARKIGLKEDKLKTIYNGIDNSLFTPQEDKKTSRQELGLPQNSFIYMYYGRPGLSKGVEYLIQAVPLILKVIPDSKLLLILSNDPQDKYKKITEMIRHLKIENIVILLDSVSVNTLIDYISASDCVVIPSLSEGFGFAAAEACAMGKPVVASNVASLPEVISGEYVMVEPADPKSIADGVIRIYKGDIQKSERKTFDWDKCVSQYLDVYRTVIAGT
jgi:D-inositol-3-phosphate glycosyltransferase